MESGEMNTEILGVALQIVLLIVISYPLGKYIAKVYKGEKTWSDFMKPVERLIYKVAGVNPEEEMNWKQFLKALLILNAFWFVWGMVLLCTQQWLPLNPDGNANQTPDLAFNTCISFMVNCNLQHYSGESGLSYAAQMCVIIFMMFTSAASGYAACMAFCRGLSGRKLGNFYRDMVRITTRILIPVSFIVGLILVSQGTPQTLMQNFTVETIEGKYQDFAMGPVAALESIKHLGTNGGGFFGANSTTPFENPTVISNIVELLSMMILPGACIVTFGHMLHDRKKNKVKAAAVAVAPAKKKNPYGTSGRCSVWRNGSHLYDRTSVMLQLRDGRKSRDR